MFAIAEEHYNEVTLQNNDQISSSKMDAPMSITRLLQVIWHFLL